MAHRFGRSLPPPEQTFIVVTDSVAKQVPGLLPCSCSLCPGEWQYCLQAVRG